MCARRHRCGCRRRPTEGNFEIYIEEAGAYVSFRSRGEYQQVLMNGELADFIDHYNGGRCRQVPGRVMSQQAVQAAAAEGRPAVPGPHPQGNGTGPQIQAVLDRLDDQQGRIDGIATLTATIGRALLAERGEGDVDAGGEGGDA